MNKVIRMFWHNQNEHPKELVEIQNIWKEKADAYGDIGSCVCGAGFCFKYKKQNYKMCPISMWQGSCSWEASVPEIKQMLIDIGCTEVYFEYGNLD